MDGRRTLAVAGLLLALAVAFGAFGAHGLKSLPPDRLQVYETAVRYHFFNALGLLGIGLALRSVGDAPLLHWAAWLVLVGIVLFSGSLYALTFNAPRLMGVVTPIGGLALIAGWLAFAAAFLRT